jgi:hypothetical protein
MSENWDSYQEQRQSNTTTARLLRYRQFQISRQVARPRHNNLPPESGEAWSQDIGNHKQAQTLSDAGSSSSASGEAENLDAELLEAGSPLLVQKLLQEDTSLESALAEVHALGLSAALEW